MSVFCYVWYDIRSLFFRVEAVHFLLIYVVIFRPAGPIKFDRLSIADATDEKLINIIGQLMSTYKK